MDLQRIPTIQNETDSKEHMNVNYVLDKREYFKLK